MRQNTLIHAALFLCLLLAGCRGDLPFIPSEEEDVPGAGETSTRIRGLYVLNEGNMGSN